MRKKTKKQLKVGGLILIVLFGIFLVYYFSVEQALITSIQNILSPQTETINIDGVQVQMESVYFGTLQNDDLHAFCSSDDTTHTLNNDYEVIGNKLIITNEIASSGAQSCCGEENWIDVIINIPAGTEVLINGEVYVSKNSEAFDLYSIIDGYNCKSNAHNINGEYHDGIFAQGYWLEPQKETCEISEVFESAKTITYELRSRASCEGGTATTTLTIEVLSQTTQSECVVASDCEGKYHIAVPGSWECQNNNCVWIEEPQGECSTGDIKYYTCSDGTKVNWCTCEGGEWACILSPENECPQEQPSQDETSPLLYIIPILTAILFLIILIIYKILKRK